MPVRRYRSIEEMPEAPIRAPDDPELWRAIRELWDFAALTCGPSGPPGVYKHRSIEEAQAQRDAWERLRVRARQRS